MSQKAVAPEIRFWRHVQKGAECWEWSGATHVKGYGRFQRGNGVVNAHRFSWEMTHGAIPSGVIVMHQCDNRRCVNPQHLMLGTPMANSRDMVAKGRSAKGSRHSQAVMTEELVAELRRRYGAGEPLKRLAKEAGIAYGTVQSAIYVNWKNVPPFKRAVRGTTRPKTKP